MRTHSESAGESGWLCSYMAGFVMRVIPFSVSLRGSTAGLMNPKSLTLNVWMVFVKSVYRDARRRKGRRQKGGYSPREP